MKALLLVALTLLASTASAAKPVKATTPALPAPDLSAAPLDVPSAKPVKPGAGDASSSGELGFDLLGPSADARPSADALRLQAMAETRRTVLTVHQTVGLTTLALLAATVVVGQLNYMDKFGGGAPNNTGRFELAHELLAYGTLAGFATTGALGLFAPVPYDKPPRLDTTMLHKLCMVGATLGMMAELGLGLYTASHEGRLDQRAVAEAHQVIGFSTLGFMGAGASAFIF